MMPLQDDNPTSTTPIVTVGLILLNVTVFAYQLLLSAGAERLFIYQTAAIPYEFTHFIDRSELPIPGTFATYPSALVPFPLSIFSAMFVHGGFMHVGGNMLYLWIFGNNIEDSIGHVRFLLFYFLTGLVAALVHIFAEPNSILPMIGASGAIAGVLGAYFVLFPYARVKTLVILFIIIRIIQIPAVVLLGLWFLMQVMNSADGGGGVAWYAHIGGFLAGMFLVRSFQRPGHSRVEVHPGRQW